MEHMSAKKVGELSMSSLRNKSRWCDSLNHDWCIEKTCFCNCHFAPGKIIEKPPRMSDRWLQCPKCDVRMPLADGINYRSDYSAIQEHSECHDPPVVGPWADVDIGPGKIIEKPTRMKYKCAIPGCGMWFTDLNCIPKGWSVTCQMVPRPGTDFFSALSYRCLCEAHQEDNYAPDMAALSTNTVSIYNGVLTAEKIRERMDLLDKMFPFSPMKSIGGINLCACGAATETCLNPDAVAVKWYECAQCGRTRSETVRAEVW